MNACIRQASGLSRRLVSGASCEQVSTARGQFFRQADICIMVNAATSPSSARLSTKALAAAGQFRAIALWLNEPLIPQGIYAQVQPDRRPGRLRIVAEYERPPAPQRLTQYVCHLIWQLNSPYIEGIYLIARPIGQSQAVWEQRVRVMTPALKERRRRQQGQKPSPSPMPPAIAHRPPAPAQPMLFGQQLKTLRVFMMTGSAVAAFVFGCMVEVLLSAGPEPSLPFQSQRDRQTEVQTADTWWETDASAPASEPLGTEAVLTHRPDSSNGGFAEADPTGAAVSISYQVSPNRDRPNVVNAALEPVGVLEHDPLPVTSTEQTVTLLFGGDVNLDDLPYSRYTSDDQLLAGVPDYQTADIAMVNLDDPLATAATTLEEELIDRQRTDAIALLKAGGVDIVNLSSSEILSYGEQGLTETLDALDRHGIYRVGAGRNEREARRPEILDVKGQRIAYLSYDRSGDEAALGAVGGVNSPSKQAIIEDIRAIRDEVDWLVVNYRWEQDIPEKPADFQTNLARLAIDQGADLVVGHHPTQLQGAEIYKGRPIAYSLGDFVFGAATEETTAETAVLQVSLRNGQMKVDLIPVKVEAGQPQRVNGAAASAVLEKIQTASQQFEKPLPATVVLDARPAILLETTDTTEPESFVDEANATDETWVDEGSPAPGNEPFSTEPLDDPGQAPLNEPLLNHPLEAEETLDVEVEPIPEGLLDNWGPKSGSGTLEPESVLPEPTRLQPQKPLKTGPDSTTGMEVETSAPQPPPEKATEKATEKEPDPGAISPHSEPLVGPLSALPSDYHPLKQDTNTPMKTVARDFKNPTGTPETRVLQPLNVLNTVAVKVQTVAEDKAAAIPTASQN